MSFPKFFTAILLLALLASFFFYSTSDKLQETQLKPMVDSINKPARLSKRDRMDLAMEQEFERIKDVELGYVPRERLYKAYLEAERRRVEYANGNKFMLS
ncbi:MAG: hypothetical protein AAFP70_14845, partial [Calditrichota bacterium]